MELLKLNKNNINMFNKAKIIKFYTSGFSFACTVGTPEMLLKRSG